MSRTAAAIAIVLAALALTPASASSAEITGCLTQRGTLTKVAPGPRPAAPCSPQQAKRVSIPVISGGAGRPGTARVDSYTFFAEVSTAGAQPTPGSGTGAGKTIFELNVGQDLLVWLHGECGECLDFGCGGEIHSTANGASIQYATSLPSAAGSEGRGGSGPFSQEGYVLLAETLSPDPELGGPHLGTGVRVLNLIGSHVRAKVEIAATVNGERPALCTFSGTVDIIRAR